MTSNIDTKLNDLRERAVSIRRGALRALYAAGSGHVGASMSAADLLAGLYFHRLRFRPEEPDWQERDRFVLSKGHANAALVATLAEAGFFNLSGLDTFNDFESEIAMHPDIKLAGIEMCTGALGHGLPVAVGMAMGAKLQARKFETFVMLGDGELQEGSNWEAVMFAAHHQLSNLTAIVDFNKVQQSARVAETLSLDSLADKWRAFGWAVREIDGHEMSEVILALDALPFNTDQPSTLIAHTVKGKGLSFAEDTYKWHSNMVGEDIYRAALNELGDPSE